MAKEMLDKIVNDFVENKPEASEFADRIIAQQEADNADIQFESGPAGANGQPTESVGTIPEPLSDAIGEIFDPNIHATNASGQPIFNKDGSHRKRRGKRSDGVSPPPPVVPRVPSAGCKEAAQVTVTSIFIIGESLFGDEWRPVIDETSGKNEPQMMVQAWTEFYMSMGIESFPPWLGVMIATGAYALPRFSMPKTQTRFGRIWEWLKPRIPFINKKAKK